VPGQLPRTGGTTGPALLLTGLGAGISGLLLRRLRRAG
jgi:LPXTG-motif cell wall-anchored protein